MFRKRMAAVMVVVMLFSIAAPMKWGGAQPANAASAKYLHLDFDTYPSEPSIAGPASASGGGGNWSLFDTVAGTDYAIGEEVPGKAGKSFTMVSNTTGKNINIQKSNLTIPSDPSSVVVMEGQFKFNTTTHERRLFYANLTKQPDATVLGYVTVVTDTQGKMKLQYPSPTGNVTKEMGNYAADTWYHIQVYVDIEKRLLQVYVNGEQLLADVETSNNWDNLRHFRFTQIGNSDQEGRMTIDDVKVYDFIPVAGITLDQAEFNLLPGTERQLTAAVLPADSTNTYVDWSSDQPSVAEVDGQGKVTALSAGTATITARSKENGMIAASSVVTVASYEAVESVEVIPAAVQVETERTAVLEAMVMPANATNKAVSWISDNPAAAQVDPNGIVTGIAPGTAIITATSEDGGKTGQSVVTVVPRNTAVGTISIPVSAKVAIGDTITMTPKFQPEDATDQSVSWVSDNEAVAEVDASGVITGKSAGTATITVFANGGGAESVSASSAIEVVSPSVAADEFDEMRLKWKSILDGGPDLNTSHAMIAAQIADINAAAAKQWSRMIVAGPRETLWPDILPSTTDSSFFNTYLTRLRDMTYAYSMKGGELYHNVSLLRDIIGGLDWIYENAYNETVAEYGNWWNFDIGAPLRVMDIMVMLYDELSAEQINRFVRTADHFIGDIMDPAFDSSGANRSDVMTIESIMGFLTKDSDRLEDVLVQLKPLFVYVTDGDGFYEDGSYIQHNTIPYTGSYGEVLIRGIGNLFYLLKDTAWEVTDPNAVNVYRWIYESVSPVVYRGETMDMIRGRAIAREDQSGHHATIGIMSGIIRLSMAAPEEDSLNFKKMIKHWLLTTNPALDVYDMLRLDLIEPTEAIMNDPAIEPEGDLPAHFEFGAMNRTVHYGEDFAFGISKSSRRIATYELTNGENGEGWYTGDGMTYLYTKDSTQFSDDFWATVNRYRLPGTTVDTRPRKNDHYQYGDGETTPNNTWAGGVTLGHDGVSGMNLQQVGTTLRANKSWFMFGDTIVALGSGITSEDGRTIETIVEQRKINRAGNNALTVDGSAQSTELGWSDQLDEVSWIHLAGNTAGSDIGYYFPDHPNLNASRTANSGTWYAINQNDSASKDVRTRNYVSFWFDHGASPVDETYSYVLLPNRTTAETAQFAASPTISIIENSDEVHAVRDLSGNQLGINFWKDQVKTAAGVTSNRQASVLMKENSDHTLEIAVSDPTFMNTGAIEIEIDRSAAAVLSADPEIFVTQLHPTIKFKVSTKGSLSRSFVAKFDMDPGKTRPDAEAALPLPVNSKESSLAEVPITHVYSLFDNEKLGDQPKNWTIHQSVNTIATVEALENSSDRFLRLLDRNANGSVIATSEFASQNGFLHASWKYIDLYGASGTQFRMMNGDMVAAELVSRAGGLYYVDGSGKEHLVKATEAAHWYTVDLYLDAVSGQWDIFVDGEPGVLAQFKNAVPAIDRIQIATGDKETDAAVYVDDIAVYVTGAIPLVADEFETYDTGGSPGDWIVVENKENAPVYVVYDEEELNKSVLMDDQNTSFRSTMKKTFAPQSGRLVAEWRYKEMGGGKYPEFQILSNTTQAIRLSSSSNNYLRYYGPGASANSTAEKAKTKVNTWHTVKLDIDIATNKYDIYFDGMLAESQLTFYTSVQEIDGILFGSAYSAADAPIYIDSVKVYAFDTTAPAWDSEAQLSVAEVGSSGLTLTWPHAADDVAVGSYRLFRDGQFLQSVSGNATSYKVTGLSPETEYSFVIEAVDTSGNRSVETLEAIASTLAEPEEEEEEEEGNPGQGGGDSGNPDSPKDPSSPTEEENGPGEVIITASQWSELVKKAQNGAVPIEAGGLAVMLPADLLDMEQLAKELKADPSELTLHIMLGQAPNAAAKAFGKAVAASGNTVLVSDVIQFGLSVQANGAAKEINSFGQSYVERRITLDDAADLSGLSVVQLDPVTGSLIFVPARFAEINGVKTAVVRSVNTGLFAVVRLSKSFEDTNKHWAKEEIEELASKLLVKGMTDSLFKPDAAITRAQFTALLVRSLGLFEQAEGASFTDVSENAWYYGALSAAVNAGLIQGYADRSFRPDAPVSREEMAVLTVRAMQFAGHSAARESNDGEVLAKFADRSRIQAWAASAVAELVEAGVIQGMTSDTFAPEGNLTRAQTAVVLKRMLSILEFI